MQERKGDLEYTTAEIFDDNIDDFVPVWHIRRATGDGAWLGHGWHLKSDVSTDDLRRMYPGIKAYPRPCN